MEPYQRQYLGIHLDVEFRASSGDLFAWMPGLIRPPKEDTLLAKYLLAWDTDGFREPARQAGHYPIAAFGDSFTEGPNVELPWPDRLAETLQVPVRNFGYRGYGPLEVGKAVQEFARKEPRTWLLFAFFAGNDLEDTNRSQAILGRSPFYLLPFLVKQSAENVATKVAPPPGDRYVFPMPVIIGGNYYEMAFLPDYLWTQYAPPQGFAASKTFTILSQALDSMASATGSETCRALVFVPTKEQLYYPYIYPTEHQWLRILGQQLIINDKGLLEFQPHPYTDSDEQYLLAHLNDQHDAIAKLVMSKPDWRFIDLLPAFQEAVRRGELLYYPFDTHWNQAGHDLAARIIASAMKNVKDCPLP